MQSEFQYFNCGEYLKTTLSKEISEIEQVLQSVSWEPSFHYETNGTTYQHQAAYNMAFRKAFISLGWEDQPVLLEAPKLIGDFRKGLVFIEVQFGNSSTLYRDYYKFQYGLANGLLSLAVLIVPIKPSKFFPTRANSVNNMADFALAKKCLTVLPLNVPTLLIGLEPTMS